MVIKKKEILIILASEMLNISLAALFALIIISSDFVNKQKVKEASYELKADCIIKETPAAIDAYGSGKENRLKVTEYINDICGAKPFHMRPTQEKINEALEEY